MANWNTWLNHEAVRQQVGYVEAVSVAKADFDAHEKRVAFWEAVFVAAIGNGMGGEYANHVANRAIKYRDEAFKPRDSGFFSQGASKQNCAEAK